MKKIVLTSLPVEIQGLISDRAERQKVSREDAVIAFLKEAEIERAVAHDIELMKSWRFEEDEEPRVSHSCCHCCCRR